MTWLYYSDVGGEQNKLINLNFVKEISAQYKIESDDIDTCVCIQYDDGSEERIFNFCSGNDDDILCETEEAVVAFISISIARGIKVIELNSEVFSALSDEAEKEQTPKLDQNQASEGVVDAQNRT